MSKILSTRLPMQSQPLVNRRLAVAAVRMLVVITSSSSSTLLNRSSNYIPTFNHVTARAATSPNTTFPNNNKRKTIIVGGGVMKNTSKCCLLSAVVTEEGSGEASPQDLVVVSFYKFADFPDHAHLRNPLKDLCQHLRVSGGIILAPEGINGSLCGIRKSVEEVLKFIQSDKRLEGLRQVESPVSPEEEAIHHGHSSSSPLAAGEDAPFRWDHVRVKLKKEIVSLGMPTVSPTERVGKYVNPKEWNELIKDPDTVVIDVRNDYETRIGKFKGAVDPCTIAFREFPSWVEEKLQKSAPESQNQLNDGTTLHNIENQGQKSPPRVAMYCTGGIRCEKASSYLLSQGFGEVYHLEGGILKYLEEVPKSESLWEGECFVFDKRVSVDHGLVQGTFKLCYGGKQPVSDADMEAPEWEYGVSCPYCYSEKSEEEKERARARQRQFVSCGVIGGPDKGRRPTKMSHISGKDGLKNST